MRIANIYVPLQLLPNFFCTQKERGSKPVRCQIWYAYHFYFYFVKETNLPIKIKILLTNALRALVKDLQIEVIYKIYVDNF